MGGRNSRYRKMESVITAVLFLDAAVFLAYLICAGIGNIAFKIIAAILCVFISGGVLYFLYMTRELLRKRSLWMTLGAACILICLLASLILNFPAPRFTLP